MTAETTGPNYDVYSIDFLTDPESAGLPSEFADMGVIQATEEGTEARYTFLVEHDYGVLARQARRDIEGFIPLAITAVRWARIGWRADWEDPNLNPAWGSVYPMGYQG